MSLFLMLPAWFGCGGANETKRYREIALRKKTRKEKTRRRSPRPVRRYVCVTTGYKLAQTRTREASSNRQQYDNSF
ncbi:hypothetical protein V1478_009243 [Vespula squamosa]|uniref:Secreted protein n=1 Tax=Vespula squamosa TaxID=30214 RepID=A0ABD2AR61_VESSQ